ncbi:MAG: YdcF family protein [Gammaproteobacteria bacterium]|nr:YdcF family protein [Gammaproteobacteria bacterium]
MISTTWTSAIALLILPPGVIILVIVLGLLLHVKRPWVGATVIGLATAALVALSLPQTGRDLMASLEAYAPPLSPTLTKPGKNIQAIVVLGGGRYSSAPEYGGDTVGPIDLVRLRYAAWLQRRTGLPILVSGGSRGGQSVSEAALMRNCLEQDFGARVRWVEGQSRTTWENARYSRRLLAAAKIRNVYLVTNAWHMRRAAWAFDANGIEATPAPTGFATLGPRYSGLLGYLPSAKGLMLSATALRERLGFIWYNLVYG